MTEADVRWVPVASYPARYLAEIPLQTLQAEGIPVMVKGEEPGIWGGGYLGPTSVGIELMVPEPLLDEAAAVLRTLWSPEADLEDGED